jgi:hypothetical protein
MPLTDKELALQLLQLLEDLMVRQSLLQVMLQCRDSDWQRKYPKVLEQNEVEARKVIRPYLDRARTRILEAPDLSSVVEQLLRDIPKNDSKQ